MKFLITMIRRIIAHEVKRASLTQGTPSFLSHDLILVEEAGEDLLRRRLVDTIASGSHCVEMTVEDSSLGTPFDFSTRMLDANDSEFIRLSQTLARTLSGVQTSGAIRSGMVIFIDGECYLDNTIYRFLALIKADADEALSKNITENMTINLEYSKNMILGDSQRLIKIALFVENDRDLNFNFTGSEPRNDEDFSIYIYDHLMHASGDRPAAVYFYKSFLKCKMAESDAKKTKDLYYCTLSFIDEQIDLSASDKLEFQSDVISYFRGNRNIIEPEQFTHDVLPEAYHDSFRRRLRDQGFNTAFTKNIALLRGKMRRRTLKFDTNVTIYAPPDVFSDSVKLLGETEDGWTKLQIRGKVES